jgi:CHAT domain-containing protein
LPERSNGDFKSLRAQAYRDLVFSELFAELPETEDEAQDVADALGVPEEEKRKVLQLRENASRARVFELQKDGTLANSRYLLLAMHGVLPDEVEHVAQSALVLSDDFLTMADVVELQLNADLVSLSACNTGMGTSIRGEGVMGLTRAFMYAGTPSVAVTLWSVESLSAKELDVGFFQQLTEGKSPASALQAVKIRMLQGKYGAEYRYPYYWAPFVIFGDGS